MAVLNLDVRDLDSSAIGRKHARRYGVLRWRLDLELSTISVKDDRQIVRTNLFGKRGKLADKSGAVWGECTAAVFLR